MKKTWPPMTIPPVPDQIRQAAKEARLVLFIGAGVSRLMGAPSWDEFAGLVLEQLVCSKSITYAELKQLSNLDARKRLSIALQIAETDELKIDFDKLIHRKGSDSSKIYEHLRSIDCVYVTTNYDEYLDTEQSRAKVTLSTDGEPYGRIKSELICRPHQFQNSILRKQGAVIHLHGSLKDRDSMIMTTPHYINHYANSDVKSFLHDLFSSQTVLFIGYGMEEWDILEYLLTKGRHAISRTSQFFMLMGFYSHQEKTFDHLYKYYKELLGVELIHFILDFLDHSQLEKIMESWSVSIEIGTPLLSDDYKFVMEVASE